MSNTRRYEDGSGVGCGLLGAALWLVGLAVVLSCTGCGAGVLPTCTANEAAIVAAPCGALSPDECEARDRADLERERQRCNTEAAR